MSGLSKGGGILLKGLPRPKIKPKEGGARNLHTFIPRPSPAAQPAQSLDQIRAFIRFFVPALKSATRNFATHLTAPGLGSTGRYAASAQHRFLPSDLPNRVRASQGGLTFHRASGRPMGPTMSAVRHGGANQVGLGTARNYSSAARPLFQNVSQNISVAARAFGNGLEDCADEVSKMKRQARLGSNLRSSSNKKSSRSLEKACRVNTNASIDSSVSSMDHYFPSACATIPVAAPSSKDKETQLIIPLTPSLSDLLTSENDSMMASIAQHHRSAFIHHSQQIDHFLGSLRDAGVFLDSKIAKMEYVRANAYNDEMMALKIVWKDRSVEDVREVLEQLGVGAHEGGFFHLNESICQPLIGVTASAIPSAEESWAAEYSPPGSELSISSFCDVLDYSNDSPAELENQYHNIVVSNFVLPTIDFSNDNYFPSADDDSDGDGVDADTEMSFLNDLPAPPLMDEFLMSYAWDSDESGSATSSSPASHSSDEMESSRASLIDGQFREVIDDDDIADWESELSDDSSASSSGNYLEFDGDTLNRSRSLFI